MFRIQSFLFILLGLSIFPGYSQSLQADLGKSFKEVKLISIDTKDAFQQASKSGNLKIADMQLNLAPRDLRAANYKAIETTAAGDRALPKGNSTTYRGFIKGDRNSEVRLAIDEKRLEGYIFKENQKLFIEPAKNHSSFAGNNDFVIYREENLIHKGDISCPIHPSEKIESGKRMVASNSQENFLTYKVLEVATESDFEFTNAKGGPAGANTEILEVLNMVEGVYQREMGITIDVTFQHTWTTPDPYPNTNSEGILQGFKAHWNAVYPMATYSRDTAHIWTAKSNSLAQGIAFFQVVCSSPASAYGLTGQFDYTPTKYILTAHEIAHNLGANHVNTAANPECGNTTMLAIISTETPFTFCGPSRTEVAGFTSANGSCLSERNAAATRFDFDGDSKADLALFRPSNGIWFIPGSANGAFSAFQFGQNGDKTVAADYDGDRKTDVAVYRGGAWYVMKSSDNTFYPVYFGNATDIPAPADFDGDGKTDVAVFRGSMGAWFSLPSLTGSLNTKFFGQNGDMPLPADFDADGKADLNIFRPSNGIWFRSNSADGSTFGMQFGQTGDKPQLGDFDGDGKTDLTVYRNGAWYIFKSTTNNFEAVYFGNATDIPAPADFDGDGKTDVCVYRNGNWFRLNSGNGAFVADFFGLSGDQPAASR